MNFKEFLYKNKLKQVDIAKYLNITEASVSRFAKGIANLSKENLCKLLDNPYSWHTFACLLLSYGTGIYTTSKLLGHTSVKTTEIYAHIVDEKKRAAVDNIPKL